MVVEWLSKGIVQWNSHYGTLINRQRPESSTLQVPSGNNGLLNSLTLKSNGVFFRYRPDQGGA